MRDTFEFSSHDGHALTGIDQLVERKHWSDSCSGNEYRHHVAGAITPLPYCLVERHVQEIHTIERKHGAIYVEWTLRELRDLEVPFARLLTQLHGVCGDAVCKTSRRSRGG